MANWLRKSGTNEVFVRTAILAGKPDMFPIDEEDAMILRAKTKGKPEKRFGSELPATAPALTRTIDAMSEDELRAKAAELKVSVKDSATADQIRKKLKKVIEKDAEEMAASRGTAATTVATPQAQHQVVEPPQA